MLVALSLILISCPVLAQTWTALANHTGRICQGPPILFSDGTVGVLGTGTAGNNAWDKLTPDIHGNYVSGTWTPMANMDSTREDFSSQLLKDGRLYIAGGEYGTGGATATIYNPLTNTWTSTNPPGFAGAIADANSEILSDGTVLQAAVDDNGGRGCRIYNPVTNSFGPTILALKSEWEASYSKLPDGSILMVDFDAYTSERYIPSLGAWVADSNVPVYLYDAAGETGGSYLLPNGKLFCIGASGHTAIYTPSGNNTPGTWVAGPDLPDNTGQKDAGGVMMATGKILLAASPLSVGEYAGPTYFYEYNYQTNSYTRVSAPGGGTSLSSGCYHTYFLALPNGSVMFGNYQVSDLYYIYTPSGSPLAAGKPAVTNTVQNSCGNYTLTGTLFGGISEGAGYGDDAQSFSNYPIVKLISGSNVYYARTFNWSTRGVQEGTKSCTTQFTLPANLPPATYSMVVSVNGISSDTTLLTTTSCATCYAPPNVTASGISATSATLSWGAVTDAAYYYIYYKKSTDTSWTVGPNNLTTTSVVLSGLTAGTAYMADVWVKCNSGSYLSTRVTFSTASGGALNPNTYYKIVNRASGKVLDVKGSSTNNSANIIQYDYLAGASQQWRVADPSSSGYFNIINHNSSKEVDDPSASLVNGTDMIQYAPNGGTNHQWQIVDLGTGYYKILNRASGLALDDSASSTINGTNIIQYTYGGGNNQQWQFIDLGISAPVPPSGVKPPLGDNNIFTSVKIAPNPATRNTTVIITAKKNTPVLIQVVNAGRRVLLSRRQDITTGINSIALDVSDFASGIYFVVIRTAEKTVTEKLVIQR
ncbi:putative secreted protein (Por secretion system target) [Chitinophaga niastensis]|uniref:Putative secreted protein (Por secretion system target) n=1 Tax=Chitinophaga niastensis TaxID=536980 RepID=A0A2P8HJ44_CHINA|nr:RICIN domain-containing protein [Chitinophaga niastensis]PSL46200.1 putative secreted protein (Por secretion system target) [Chitinophaga niastensis]